MSAVRLSPRLSAPSGVRPSVASAAVARSGVRAAVDGFEAQRKPVVASLHRGSTGPAVRALQDRLVKLGHLSSADVATGPGVYGPRTEAGVRRFQAAVGLPVTGVTGPETQAALASGTRFQPERRPVPQHGADDVTQPTPVEHVRARLGDTMSDEVTQPMGGGL